MKTSLSTLILFLFFNLSFSQKYFLTLNSSSKKVIKLNTTDGSVISESHIDLSNHNPGIIKAIVQVNNKIWISDQTNNAIYIYNLDGTYSKTIPASAGLSNIRGLRIVNNEVWVTNAGNSNGATANSIVKLDFQGNVLGFYPTLGSPFDVLDNGQGEAFVSSFNSDGIQKIKYDGTITGNLVNPDILSGIQQMNKTTDGNLVVGVFSANTSSGNNPGLYLISSANGNIIKKWDSSVRGAIQSEDGNYLFTTGAGLYRMNAQTNIQTQITTGNLQYLTLIDEDATLAVDDFAIKTKTQVYPNPTSGKIFLNSTDSKLKSAKIYNVNGTLVKPFLKLETNIDSLDIGELSPGIYILQLETDNGVETQKIIKK